MRLRIAIVMLEIRNRKTLQSKVNICKSDVKIGDYADSLTLANIKRQHIRVYRGCKIYDCTDYNVTIRHNCDCSFISHKIIIVEL